MSIRICLTKASFYHAYAQSYIESAPYLVYMTQDEKIRYGMIALSAAGIVFATLGVKIGPLDLIGGFGTG